MKFVDLDELTTEDELLREETHKFAEKIMRPASIKLDRMSPEDRVKTDSPYFKVIKEMKRLGYHKIHLPSDLGGIDFTPLQRYIIMEELGWGSLGLATAIGVDQIPFVLAALFGSDELYEELVLPWLEDTDGKYHGCWGVTEPSHGSDYLLFTRDKDLNKYGTGDLIAERNGDEWILNGQKSAWVSSAPVATHIGLHAQVKGGRNFMHGIFAIVPLDLDGIYRSKPYDMMGMRDDPQGEVLFENVHIPSHYVIVENTPFYAIFTDQLFNLTSVGLAAFSVGLARAAFEEALFYARNRIQGGTPIIEHKNIKLMLYGMFEKIETARYYTRKAMEYVHKKILVDRIYNAIPRYARTAQIYAKKTAFEVAHDALQIFGAYGLNKDFLIEKLFRDARALLIEDGTIDVLSLDAAEDIISSYDKNYYDAENITSKY